MLKPDKRTPRAPTTRALFEPPDAYTLRRLKEEDEDREESIRQEEDR